MRSKRYQSDAARYAALASRDPDADGQFLYSVRTTGVYCRPSCASRLPLRKNVAFHDSTEAAERAGFRPCKRCQPNGRTLEQEQALKMEAACRILESTAPSPSLDRLAKAAGMSRFHFHRVFTKLVGVTPKAYAKARRAEQLRLELSRRGRVTDAIYQSGYNSSARCYAESNALLGMTPKRFRAGGKGEAIQFAAGESTLGSVLVASSTRGVCAIFLGDDPEQLARDLQDRFPHARIIGGDRNYERIVARVIRFVESPGSSLDLPLDIRGTAFQQRVWKALQEISPGGTSTYTDVAKRIGSPAAVRAVAGACAANAHAVAIPCHRVVRNDGSLSGYRWGAKRKRALLDMEAKKQPAGRAR